MMRVVHPIRMALAGLISIGILCIVVVLLGVATLLAESNRRTAGL